MVTLPLFTVNSTPFRSSASPSLSVPTLLNVNFVGVSIAVTVASFATAPQTAASPVRLVRLPLLATEKVAEPSMSVKPDGAFVSETL